MRFNYQAFKAIYLHEMDRFKRTLGQSLLSPVLSTSLYFIVFVIVEIILITLFPIKMCILVFLHFFFLSTLLRQKDRIRVKLALHIIKLLDTLLPNWWQ